MNAKNQQFIKQLMKTITVDTLFEKWLSRPVFWEEHNKALAAYFKFNPSLLIIATKHFERKVASQIFQFLKSIEVDKKVINNELLKIIPSPTFNPSQHKGVYFLDSGLKHRLNGPYKKVLEAFAKADYSKFLKDYTVQLIQSSDCNLFILGLLNFDFNNEQHQKVFLEVLSKKDNKKATEIMLMARHSASKNNTSDSLKSFCTFNISASNKLRLLNNLLVLSESIGGIKLNWQKEKKDAFFFDISQNNFFSGETIEVIQSFIFRNKLPLKPIIKQLEKTDKNSWSIPDNINTWTATEEELKEYLQTIANFKQHNLLTYRKSPFYLNDDQVASIVTKLDETSWLKRHEIHYDFSHIAFKVKNSESIKTSFIKNLNNPKLHIRIFSAIILSLADSRSTRINKVLEEAMSKEKFSDKHTQGSYYHHELLKAICVSTLRSKYYSALESIVISGYPEFINFLDPKIALENKFIDDLFHFHFIGRNAQRIYYKKRIYAFEKRIGKMTIEQLKGLRYPEYLIQHNRDFALHYNNTGAKIYHAFRKNLPITDKEFERHQGNVFNRSDLKRWVDYFRKNPDKAKVKLSKLSGNFLSYFQFKLVKDRASKLKIIDKSINKFTEVSKRDDYNRLHLIVDFLEELPDLDAKRRKSLFNIAKTIPYLSYSNWICWAADHFPEQKDFLRTLFKNQSTYYLSSMPDIYYPKAIKSPWLVLEYETFIKKNLPDSTDLMLLVMARQAKTFENLASALRKCPSYLLIKNLSYYKKIENWQLNHQE